MTSINSIGSTDTSLIAAGVAGAESAAKTGSVSGSLPAGTASDPILNNLDLPDLPLSMRGVSIDQLLTAISDEARRNGVQSAVNNIETQGEAMEAENAKKLEEIKKELDKLKNQSFWQKFCKVFQVIGAVIGAIASAATIVAGAMTGNPLLIAAGVVGMVSTIDSAVSLASDGKYSIAAGFTALGKKCGMSDEAAQWLGMGVSLGITLTSVALGFGAAGVANSASKVADASKLLNVISKATAATNIASGVTGIGSGVGQIGLTVAQYQVAQSKAKQVDIDAILEGLRNTIKMNEALIEEELKAADDLISAVNDIVEDCGQTATAILTAAPATA